MILNNLKITSLSEESIGATDGTSLEGALFKTALGFCDFWRD